MAILPGNMIESICICGAGTMGSGIAQVCAVAGFNTVLFDVNAAMLQRSEHSIRAGLDVLAGKGKVTVDEVARILSRLRFTPDITECRADVVIEAIIENEDEKVSLFNTLAGLNPPETIFATNTSSIPVSAIGARLSNPSRLVGMHFFNPAPILRLVEVVKGTDTAEAVVNSIYDLAIRLGKTPVICNDSPGFIVNRVARPYYLEALKIVASGIATPALVDQVMEATGFKMGPFRLMDLIGMDVNYQVSTLVWDKLGRPPRLAPSDLQKQVLESGKLGRKSGEGFYIYNKS
ncbi:3-hydroxybutyryl-CoA dehydrogenase [Segetibacter sp. 3557_3]|uniref:3-hydroxyacyl-CoA dehydrogenase family protein n=1 Tax=Segetibacter sp. 3557_3 TaxID=2547429 RepID=UPI001058F544|nr:3-hydroxyacyl-CoA dehydrogenase NAD-binding domain-containing protein [Segetibacter sp. 3557_3]TDH18349.1 3-hydroxybutyryl-CoA dehydrogenase [Segetibacter sp. 3557_3]